MFVSQICFLITFEWHHIPLTINVRQRKKNNVQLNWKTAKRVRFSVFFLYFCLSIGIVFSMQHIPYIDHLEPKLALILCSRYIQRNRNSIFLN